MSEEFEGIEGFEGWSAKLGELLLEAEQGALSEDFDSFAMRERLHALIMASPNEIPEVRRLDDIARQARKDLVQQDLEQRLMSITERTNELTQVTKHIEAITADAAASARKIRLEKANKVAATLTGAVQALRDLESSLGEESDAEILASLGRVVSSIQRFRSTVETEI